MIISALLLDKRTKNCRIIFDDDSFIKCSLDLVLKHGLRKGFALDNHLFDILLGDQRVLEAKQTAYNYASYKPRTTKQVKEKLRFKKFEQEEIEIAIKFLKKFNLLNDEAFAKSFIISYLKKKPSGPRKILFELIHKGIHKELANTIINDYYPYDEIENIARKALEKKIKRSSKSKAENQKQKIAAYLYQLGFDSSVISKVLAEFISEHLMLCKN